MILAGDVGGTYTRLALFDSDSGLSAPRLEKKYPSMSASSLLDVIQQFMDENQLNQSDLKAAAYAVAGPVVDQKSDITNLPWKTIDSQELSAGLGGVPTSLMNDLVGLSNFVPVLGAEDLFSLNQGVQGIKGAKAVIAPGTGLGESYLAWDGRDYHPSPSEGGHTDFGPIDDQQLALLEYLMPEFGHVSYERVCSGLGIPNLYDFLKSTSKYDEPAWLKKSLAETADPVPVIFNGALRKVDFVPICVETVKLFSRILGSEAGNLALKSLAVSGVYIGGGIPPRIIPFLQEHFMPAFLYKGRFSSVLETYPVNIITHDDPVLYGAARRAFSLIP